MSARRRYPMTSTIEWRSPKSPPAPHSRVLVCFRNRRIEIVTMGWCWPGEYLNTVNHPTRNVPKDGICWGVFDDQLRVPSSRVIAWAPVPHPEEVES